MMLRKLVYSLLVGLILSNPCYANTQEKFIATEGAELFCRVMGEGKPIIVIHGGAGYVNQDYLLPGMARLAENNLVVFYDQRGLGKSTGELNSEQIDIKTYIEDIETIRKSLGVKKITLLGHSWGTFLGMHYAITHPESIEKLILLNSMPASSEDLGSFFTALTKRLAPCQEELDKIESSELYLVGDPETVETHLRTLFQTYLYKPEDINKLNLYQTQKGVLNGFKVSEIFSEKVFMKSFNLFNDLNKLQCPTLIIHGDVDPIPFYTAENIQKAISNSKLIKIEQCGHFSYVEQPEVVFKAINDFLQ